ncbi:putative Dynein axonemal heavy chain 6 [Blattamonas nauphoetae]|uniref:Dynein axonemal heavy chain 6 n=1 Tax=Blattamonas nauphoetae TaxID=2049346 RepID=A0ABQ9X5R2_9EUKA|nr:putative Dynein axonemal heavy chain 6 [Blattamonas nauphoetae]
MEGDEENDYAEDEQEEAVQDEGEQDDGDADSNQHVIEQSEHEGSDVEEQRKMMEKLESRTISKKINYKTKKSKGKSNTLMWCMNPKEESNDDENEIQENELNYEDDEEFAEAADEQAEADDQFEDDEQAEGTELDVKKEENSKHSVKSRESLNRDKSSQSKNPPGGLKLEDVIQGDDETQTMIREMVFLIEQSFTSTETYLTRFYALSKISEFSLRWDFEQYKRNIRSVSIMRNDLRRLSQWSQDIVKINLSSLVGLITLDARPLKQNLAPIPVECADQIKSHLHDLFNSIGNETLRDLRQCTNELNNAPKNLSEYCDHVLLIGTMRERQVGFRQNVATLDDMKALGDEQASQLSMDEQQLLLSIHSSLGAFNTSFVKSEEFRDQHHMRMVAGLHKEAQKLETDTLQTSNDLQTGILVDETADPQSALQRLEVLKSTVDSYTERMAVLDKQREIIRMDAIAYPNVQRCVVKYQNRVNVWTQLKEFNSAASLWRERRTRRPSCETPPTEHRRLQAACASVERSLCSCDETSTLEKLFTALGKRWTATQTLGQIMTMNLLQNAPQVMDISATANGEYGLETQLEKIKKIWAQIQFVLVRRKSGTTHILGGVEEIVETFEDNQALLQTMLASRFVVGIREEIEGWDRRMTQLPDLIDKWVKCQRGWMYLYAILTQTDIIRQLSNEAAQFNSVDSSWKEVMKLVHENRTASDMEKNNEQLDLLQKKLQDYLETKRVKFPRFYFLSNDELLQILAQTTDARAVQPFMNKCFDAINSLQFCSEKDMKEKKTDVDEMTPEEKKAFSKLNPNSADFVTAIMSVENEVVPLLKPVSTHSPVEEWLLEFKHEMCRTINVAIRNALTHYFHTDRPNWFFHHPAQAILAVDQIVWTQNVEEALTKVDFDWMVNLRYNFDEEKQITLVKQTNTSIEYGNEYFGDSPRLVITPLTDRCYVTLTLSLHLRLGGNPAGPAGTGKTETVKGMFRRVQSNRHRSALCYRSALQQIGNLADFTVFSGILVYVLNPPVLREIKFSFTNNLSTSCFMEVSGSDLIASTEYTATSIVPLDEEDGDIFTDSSSSEEKIWTIVTGLSIVRPMIEIVDSVMIRDGIRIVGGMHAVIRNGASSEPSLIIPSSFSLDSLSVVIVVEATRFLEIRNVNVSIGSSVPSLVFLSATQATILLRDEPITGSKSSLARNVEESEDVCSWTSGILQLTDCSTSVSHQDMLCLACSRKGLKERDE